MFGWELNRELLVGLGEEVVLLVVLTPLDAGLHAVVRELLHLVAPLHGSLSKIIISALVY